MTTLKPHAVTLHVEWTDLNFSQMPICMA